MWQGWGLTLAVWCGGVPGLQRTKTGAGTRDSSGSMPTAAVVVALPPRWASAGGSRGGSTSGRGCPKPPRTSTIPEGQHDLVSASVNLRAAPREQPGRSGTASETGGDFWPPDRVLFRKQRHGHRGQGPRGQKGDWSHEARSRDAHSHRGLDEEAAGIRPPASGNGTG